MRSRLVPSSSSSDLSKEVKRGLIPVEKLKEALGGHDRYIGILTVCV